MWLTLLANGGPTVILAMLVASGVVAMWRGQLLSRRQHEEIVSLVKESRDDYKAAAKDLQAALAERDRQLGVVLARGLAGSPGG